MTCSMISVFVKYMLCSIVNLPPFLSCCSFYATMYKCCLFIVFTLQPYLSNAVLHERNKDIYKYIYIYTRRMYFLIPVLL